MPTKRRRPYGVLAATKPSSGVQVECLAAQDNCTHVAQCQRASSATRLPTKMKGDIGSYGGVGYKGAALPDAFSAVKCTAAGAHMSSSATYKEDEWRSRYL